MAREAVFSGGRLKAKLDEWTLRMDGPDVHSIDHQITTMIWWSAFYRSMNESRQHHSADSSGAQIANGQLHDLLHNGYLTIHATAMRRLVDNAGNGGARGVNSLYNLVADIRDHAHMLSREAMLEARGLPYDFEPIKQQCLEEACEAAEKEGKRGYAVSAKGWREAEYWHETWDRLCNTLPGGRSPADRPREERFCQLFSEFDRMRTTIGEYVNKYIAHAATEVSRSTLAPGQAAFSLDDLWRDERTLVKVASFVSRTFCRGNTVGNVPVPQFDQFAHLDQPFATAAGLRAMEKAWDLHDRLLSKCGSWHLGTPFQDEPSEGGS